MVDERGNSLNHIVLMPLLPPVFLYIFINLDLTRVLTLISGIILCGDNGSIQTL